jgi:hypothetical protein
MNGNPPRPLEELMMKVGIIGAGAVGSARTVSSCGSAREVVLVVGTRTPGQSRPIRYDSAIAIGRYRDGDFSDLAGGARHGLRRRQ